MLADQFVEGAKAAGNNVEKISDHLHNYVESIILKS